MSDGFEAMITAGRAFFAELAANNSRDWFEPRKDAYKRDIRGPGELLCGLFAEDLTRLTGHGHEGRVQRINSDVRFSKEKSPYTPSLNILWRRAASPLLGWLFSLSGEGAQLMTGLHALDGPALRAYRAHVDREGDGLAEAIAAAEAEGASLVTWGDAMLKRVPAPYAADHPHADLLRRKQLVLGITFVHGDLEAGLLDVMNRKAQAMLPFWRHCAETAGEG
jgi:uncharacterized protein (TIGR02453 family)